jgi:hypothetical protein
MLNIIANRTAFVYSSLRHCVVIEVPAVSCGLQQLAVFTGNEASTAPFIYICSSGGKLLNDVLHQHGGALSLRACAIVQILVAHPAGLVHALLGLPRHVVTEHTIRNTVR